MISLCSNSIDELRTLWKKIEGEYDMIEKINYNKDAMMYQMVLSKPSRSEISTVLKCLAEKVVENDGLLHEKSFFENFTYRNFLKRVEGEMNGAKEFPGIARLVFIWKELTQMEKKMLYEYLSDLTDEEITAIAL